MKTNPKHIFGDSLAELILLKPKQEDPDQIEKTKSWLTALGKDQVRNLLLDGTIAFHPWEIRHVGLSLLVENLANLPTTTYPHAYERPKTQKHPETGEEEKAERIKNSNQTHTTALDKAAIREMIHKLGPDKINQAFRAKPKAGYGVLQLQHALALPPELRKQPVAVAVAICWLEIKRAHPKTHSQNPMLQTPRTRVLEKLVSWLTLMAKNPNPACVQTYKDTRKHISHNL